MYSAFERLAPGYLIERRSGDLGASAISDLEALELYFAHTLSPLIVAVTAPLAALATLAIVHPALALAPVLDGLGPPPPDNTLQRTVALAGCAIAIGLVALTLVIVHTVKRHRRQHPG
ncbi:MAG: hypothetical protein ACRDSZ_01095 [Pseudonocardiaceae bacterium]